MLDTIAHDADEYANKFPDLQIDIEKINFRAPQLFNTNDRTFCAIYLRPHIIATGHEKKGVQIWEGRSLIASFAVIPETNGGYITEIAIFKHSSLVCCNDENNTVCIYQWRIGKLEMTIDTGRTRNRNMKVFGERFMLLAGEDCIQLWDLSVTRGTLIHKLGNYTVEKDWVHPYCLLPGGMVVVGYLKNLDCYDITTGQLTDSIQVLNVNTEILKTNRISNMIVVSEATVAISSFLSCIIYNFKKKEIISQFIMQGAPADFITRFSNDIIAFATYHWRIRWMKWTEYEREKMVTYINLQHAMSLENDAGYFRGIVMNAKGNIALFLNDTNTIYVYHLVEEPIKVSERLFKRLERKVDRPKTTPAEPTYPKSIPFRARSPNLKPTKLITPEKRPTTTPASNISQRLLQATGTTRQRKELNYLPSLAPKKKSERKKQKAEDKAEQEALTTNALKQRNVMLKLLATSSKREKKVW
jgi:hypothetical protein